MGWHTFRRTFTSRLILDERVPIPAVAALFGHSDGGALLLRVYARALAADQPSGERIDAAMGL